MRYGRPMLTKYLSFVTLFFYLFNSTQFFFLFLFTYSVTSKVYSLSLHDALPIYLQSFIASMTQKLTLSDISDESKNYLDKAGITTACLRIKSKWTAGGK